MDCTICHRPLVLWSGDREQRVALIEDGAAFCHRCAADLAHEPEEAPYERRLEQGSAPDRLPRAA